MVNILSSCSPRDRRVLLWAGIISVLSIFPYLNTLNADFTYDDKVAVVGNPDVFLKAPLSDVFTHDFWGNKIFDRSNFTWTHHSYRPLIILTFQFNRWLADFSKFWIWHSTNIFFHSVCTFIVVLVAGLLHSELSSIIISGICFAFHPVHTEVTANITSRAETVNGIFVFTAIYIGLREIVVRSPMEEEWRELGNNSIQEEFTKWTVRRKCCPRRSFTFIAIVCLYVLSILCKENALIAPMLVLVGEILFNSVIYDERRPESKNDQDSYEQSNERNNTSIKSSRKIGFFEQIVDTVMGISVLHCIGLIVLTITAYIIRIRILSGG